MVKILSFDEVIEIPLGGHFLHHPVVSLSVMIHLVGHNRFKLMFDSDVNNDSFFKATYAVSGKTV